MLRMNNANIVHNNLSNRKSCGQFIYNQTNIINGENLHGWVHVC